MKFNCKEVSVSDGEFGLTISFREKADNYAFGKERSIDEIMASMGQYIMLQRTYPEDEHEEDYWYFESSDFEKSGELTDFKIDLYRTQFVMNFDNELYEIQFNIDDHKFENLKAVLTKMDGGKGQLFFHN